MRLIASAANIIWAAMVVVCETVWTGIVITMTVLTSPRALTEFFDICINKAIQRWPALGRWFDE